MHRIILVLILVHCFTASFAQLTLLKDINTRPNPQNSGINPMELTPANGSLFFSGHSGLGQELWKYEDGGPVLVKDIFPGTESSNPHDLVEAGGIVFFLVDDDGLHRLALWRSDGTEQGTFLLMDIDDYGYQTKSLHSALGMLFMTLTSGSNELWRSDGTVEGTFLLNARTKFSSWPVEFEGSIYFGVEGDTAFELWKSDGTVAGSTMVKSIFPGEELSLPMTFVVTNDKFYFIVSPQSDSPQLWVSNGTAAGTIQVSGAFGDIDYCLNYNDALVFHVDGQINNGLWRTDGTTEGTEFYGPDDPGMDALVKGNDIYFIAWNTTNNLKYELRKWNPLIQNKSELITEIGPDVTVAATGLREYNGVLLFLASDPAGTTGGLQVWRSDGTDVGTYPITNYPYRDGAFKTYAHDLNSFDNFIYFAADDNVNGNELWKTDGTAAGTIRVTDQPAGSSEALVSGLVELNGKVYFGGNDGVHGVELMVTDGTSAGTGLLKDILPGGQQWSSHPTNFITGKDFLFFNVDTRSYDYSTRFYKTDGTSDGTVQLYNTTPDAAIHFGTTLFLSLATVNIGTELHKSEYPYTSIELVKDIAPGPNSSGIRNFVTMGDQVYFLSGGSVWKTDGSTAGTIKVLDGYYFAQMMVSGNTLYLIAGSGYSDLHLWTSNGDPGSMVKIKDFSSNSSPQLMASAGKFIYIKMFDATMTGELWRSDATEEGTIFLKKINPDYFKFVDSKFCAAGETLFFTADDGIHGTELWTSDGTADHTQMIADINPGVYSSTPLKLIASGTTIYFTAYNNETRSLYRSNGVSCGIVKLSDNVEAAGDSPVGVEAPISRNMKLIGNTLYVEGFTPETDWEIFLHHVGDDPTLEEKCRATQAITFSAVADKVVDDKPFELSAFATSTLPISFSTASDKVSLAGDGVTLLKAGRVTVTALQNGDGWTLPAAEVEESFCVNPPTPSIIRTTSVDGNSLTVDNGSATVDGYLWYFNKEKINGEGNAHLNATKSGVYTCRSFVDDCISESSEEVNVIITGIDANAEDQFYIYPNPGADLITLNLPQGHKNVSIIDAIGKPIFNFETTETTYTLSVRAFPLGVYIFKTTTNRNSAYVRFVKM